MELVKVVSNKSEKRNAHSQFVADIMNDFQRDVIKLVVGVIICGIVSLFGIIANIMNIIIFYKQGLNTTINISFFAMAISDLGSLVFQQLCNVYNNPLFVNLDLPIVYDEFEYFTTAIIRELFAKITCFLTVYVSAERCFCVAFPLQVKQMITPERTAAVIVCFYIIMFLCVIPAFSIAFIGWKVHPVSNRSLLGLMFKLNMELVDLVEGLLYLFQAILGILSFITVALLTAVLIYKLNRKSTWLKTANVDGGKTESMSNRDKVTVLMVILIASILIVCYLPSVILFSVTICEPEFAVGGRHNNLFVILWTLAMLLENINSSVNIFFYYNMSTKYRRTFRKLFLNVVWPSENISGFGANNLN